MRTPYTTGKQDFVKMLARFFGTNQEANRVVDLIFTVIREILKKNGSVTIPGFGRFHTRQYKDHLYYAASLKKLITIPAHRKARFKSFPTLLGDKKEKPK